MAFGIYIHWPFCAAKCPYCDFNSHVAQDIDHTAWEAAYVKELDYIASLTTDHIVSTIYFGGGTPSLMHPECAQHIIEHIRTKWRASNDVEITLEANPTSIELQKFEAFKRAGINRVSVGVQALNDADLTFLGRQHSAAEAKEALKVAYATFERVNFDLIYARPDQSEAAWTKELEEALNLAKAGHLSLYQLTIEPNTAFETMYKRREFIMPHDELGGRLYELTGDITRAHGYEAYEISNYARPAEKSQHNLIYWRYQDYAGIGPGAHGRLNIKGQKTATRTHRAPQIWLEKVQKNGHGYHPFTTLSALERGYEYMLMGLRLQEGISLSTLGDISGHAHDKMLDMQRIDTYIREGFLRHEKDRLCPTPAGMQRLDSLLQNIIR